MNAQSSARAILLFWLLMFAGLVGIEAWHGGRPLEHWGVLYWIVLWSVVLLWQFIQFLKLRRYLEKRYRDEYITSNGGPGIWRYIYQFKPWTHPDNQVNMLRHNASVAFIITILVFIHFTFAETMAKKIAIFLTDR